MSTLLEVPVTILSNYMVYPKLSILIKLFKDIYKRLGLPRKVINHDLIGVLDRIYPKSIWLRPDKNNLTQMIKIVDYSVLNNFDYIEFMVHSSELMPGGSPRFKSRESVDKLYQNLNLLFNHISNNYKGTTLQEYYKNKH